MMTPTLTAARAPERVALGEVLDFMRLLLLATAGKRRLAEARAVLTLLAGELLDGAGGR